MGITYLAFEPPSPQGRRPTPQYSGIWPSPQAEDQLHSTPLHRGKDSGIFAKSSAPSLGSRSCGPQMWGGQRYDEKLYSTCASPVVPHPSTGHAHGCLASEIGRDPAFPTRFDRTVDSLEVSLLASSSHWIGTESEKNQREIESIKSSERESEAISVCEDTHHRSYNQGLISADRSNKATLLLTIPRCLLSRLQRISRAQFSKLLFANQLHSLAARSMQLIRYRPKLSIHA